MSEVDSLLKEMRRRNLMKRRDKLLMKRNPALSEMSAQGGPEIEEKELGRLRKLNTSLLKTLKTSGGCVWRVAQSNTSSKKKFLKKEVERKGGNIFVYLTMINNGNKMMKNIQVIDTLPSDAKDLVVYTPDSLSGRLGRSLIWEIDCLEMGVKNIFHYKICSSSDETPAATSRWVDDGFNGVEDLNEVMLRVGGEK